MVQSVEQQPFGGCSSRVVRAHDDHVLYRNFLQLQRVSLERRGVFGIRSTDERYLTPKNIHLVLFEYGGEMVGGIRVHLNYEGADLPIQIAVGDRLDLLGDKIRNFPSGLLAELSGLWVSPNFSGRSLGASLIAKGTSTAWRLGVRAVVAFPPEHTYGHFIRLGYQRVPWLQDFPFPDERFISRVVWLGQMP